MSTCCGLVALPVPTRAGGATLKWRGAIFSNVLVPSVVDLVLIVTVPTPAELGNNFPHRQALPIYDSIFYSGQTLPQNEPDLPSIFCFQSTH